MRTRTDLHLRRVVAALARAAAEGRAARVRFRDADGPRGRPAFAIRAVDVLALAYDGERWVAATWWPPAASLRLLDASRIAAAGRARRAAGPAPAGFDARDFAVHRWLDPAAGPPRPVAVTLPRALARCAGVLLPGATRSPAGGGRVRCALEATRPGLVLALAGSLGARGEVDSASPMPPDRAEVRLLRLATFILDQSEPVTREAIWEALPRDYAGGAVAAERRFSRDKDALKRLGFALRTVELEGDQVGYVIDAHACALPKLDLTPEEALVVWTAAAGALRFSNHPLAAELEGALRKLVVGASELPPRAAGEEVVPAPGAGEPGRLLAVLADAWERRKRLTVDYWRVATGEVVTREVDVYGWASRRGEWIFVGHCHLRRGVRIFYLSRTRRLKANARRPNQPDYEIPEGFDLRRWSRQEIWQYAEHPPRPAAVRFTGSLARLAGRLVPGAKLETAPDGARLARLEVTNLRGLVRQALAWGPEAELVEPEDGRAVAREILAAVLRGAGRTP